MEYIMNSRVCAIVYPVLKRSREERLTDRHTKRKEYLERSTGHTYMYLKTHCRSFN